VFEQYGPSARLCLDLAGDERRIKFYDLELRDRLSACKDFTEAAQSYRFFRNPEQLDQLESVLLIVPDPLRLPLVTITSRPIAQSLSKDPRNVSLLGSQAEKRETGLDIWESLTRERFMTYLWSFKCPYIRIGSSTTEKVIEPPQTFTGTGYSLSSPSLSSNYDPGTNMMWNCDSLGIKTCHTVARNGLQTMLFRICREPVAIINVEELDLLATKFSNIPRWGTQGPWKLIFVVPPSMKDSFTIQPFVGESENRDGWEFGGKLVQYVAGMDCNVGYTRLAQQHH